MLAIAPFWFGEDDEISGFIAVTSLKEPKEMQ